MLPETEKKRDELLSQWQEKAIEAERNDQEVFKVPSGEGLAYSLARREMVKRYYPIADMPPEYDYYRLDIPPNGYIE
jgi:hypothetical protein